MIKLESKAPQGPLAEKWSKHKAAIKVVSPANKRKLDIIVIGTGLGGASAAASLGELGYNVKVFCISDSPRRAHSIAAQGGINAAKNYQNDNDSVFRLFYDTIKGGDYRAREANVYRLAEVSNSIIDQCVAQGVPFAREYGGLLANRSFGGAQVSRTFYARGQTGQQLLLGAYAALNRQIAAGTVKSYPRHEMLELVMVDGKARGIITRNLVTGEIERFDRKLSQLIEYYGRYGHVSPQVIDQVYDGGMPTGDGDLPEPQDVIVHGNAGLVVRARTVNQQRLLRLSERNDLLFAVGPAGSGKTYTAIALAVRALRNREVKRIILTRPAVEAGEKLGFLPGDMKEKLDPYLQPLYDALNDMIPAAKLGRFMEDGTVQIAPLAFMRGRTLDNAFVILDEAQNTTVSQLKMFLTRMGRNARFIVTGDVTQIDLPRREDSGLVPVIDMLRGIDGIGIVGFDNRDIIRHRLVKHIVEAFEKCGGTEEKP